MPETLEAQNNSFVTGFTLGLFAGAAGYFLFGTKRGAAFRQEMVKEWETTKQRLIEEGAVQPSDLSLRTFLLSLVQPQTPSTTPQPSAKKSVSKKKTAHTRFRGV